jgi:argininosuccinate lyase
LVRKGVPFRETHHISGRAVQMAEERGCALTDLSVADLQSLHALFADDVRSRCHAHWHAHCDPASAHDGVVDTVGPIRTRRHFLRALTQMRRLRALAMLAAAATQVMSVWDFEAAVERRDSTGGTSKRSVLEQAAKLEAWAEPTEGNGVKRQRTQS